MDETPNPTPLGMEPSFGFGDRIGLATPGHLAALRQAGSGIRGIFAQQSIREMTRTDRTPDEVMADAMNALRAAGETNQHGADADHLKTPADVDYTVAAGFTFFTIDPSDHVDQQADNYDAETISEKFKAARVNAEWVEDYVGKSIKLSTGTAIEFDKLALQRAAVKYGLALSEAIRLADYIKEVHEKVDRDYEIELSVDETDQPTTLAEHWIIADQCLKAGVKLVSLAPRFIGEFEKGVDFIGDTEALEKSLHDHAAIAEELGPYKISLHSGSDKLSMYASLARATKGKFHVKTAGTSYLEALRVAAICDKPLFREICEFGREHYNKDKATYHVHATLENVPSVADTPDDGELERLYLERWDDVDQGKGFTEAGRQILHCTFGSTLTDKKLGPAVRQCLEQNAGTYEEVLCDHFSRHLEALTSGM